MFGKIPIHLLIDTGSTNTFLDESTARRIPAPLIKVEPMVVNVAKWKIKGVEFKHILPLGGCEMVLVELNFNKMELTLCHEGLKVSFHATTKSTDLQLISPKKLIYSRDIESHSTHLHQVLLQLRNRRLFPKASKCAFGQSKIEYLGHTIFASSVQVDTRKIDAMVAWPPNHVKSLRGFLGLTGYYRKFVKNYGILSKPLTTLLKKDSFHWTEQATLAFENLKTAMTTTPILALPDFQKPFIVETNASSKGYFQVVALSYEWLVYHKNRLAVIEAFVGVKGHHLFAVEGSCKAFGIGLFNPIQTRQRQLGS
ncbi:hypothetical protein LIER_40450 [Lithospermum erythrorhizon]|uniref:Reverse transcriptase/retrotransposon-derived protein RNase H-like domain-containing protein n=1 Tax=Lithospermum erythrorhizon TaxID=34254 RepID=A0AAV3QWY5_LITER